MENKIKVVIVDDDDLVSMSLKTILEVDGRIEVVAVGNDGEDAVALYKQFKPDVLLTDIQMKNVSGLEAAKKIIEEFSDAKILLLTTFNDDEYIIKALKVGARGYILKQDFTAIAPAALAVSGGQTVFGGDIMEKIPKLLVSSEDRNSSSDSCSCDSMDKQTERIEEKLTECGINEKELDIIRLVAKGYNNKEIADELFLSEGTVRNYLSTILEKLQLRDRTRLAVYYLSGK